MFVKKYVAYTEDEIKKLVELWPNYSASEIARKLERTPTAIASLASKIREAGYSLPRKRRQDTTEVIKRALGL